MNLARSPMTIPGAIEIRGSDSIEKKTRALVDFSEGRTRVS